MAHNKKAADSKAEQYWIDYFGEYGRQFVREIPRSIKAALLPDFKRSAAKEKRALQVTSSKVIPLGYGVTETGSLILDGVCKVSYTERGKAKSASRLFHATFNSEGDLVEFDHRDAPRA